MNSRLLCIITSFTLVLAFFMPWVKYFGIAGTPFDFIIEISKKMEYSDIEPSILWGYLLLVFPFCGLLILIFYIQPEIKKDTIFFLDILKKAPLFLLLAGTVYGLIKIGESAKYLLDSNIFKVLGAGLYLTIISSLLLFFDPTKTGAIADEKNRLTL